MATPGVRDRARRKASSASILPGFRAAGMIEALINNAKFRRIFPPVAAAGMIGLFVSLGAWQLDRAGGKNNLKLLFENDAPYSSLSIDAPPTNFQNIETFGRYDGSRQVLIDNVILDGRLGYYIITPFRPAARLPWLIVNRGWVAKPVAGEPDPDIAVGDADRTIRGRAGHLPKVGIRSGDPFASTGTWPKKGRYPTLDDLSAELGQELYPLVLLLSPAAEDGFLRRWQPRSAGPRMHYGYAFQWFAMAAAVFGLILWRYRKRRT